MELIQSLTKAGFEVVLVFARQPDWGVGKVDAPLPIATIPLEFSTENWTIPGIELAFHDAAEKFRPDCVIITDSWSFKPHLAAAVSNYPYFLRFDALECICPLNNLRILIDDAGNVQQCHQSQLIDPQGCADCLAQFGPLSSDLHQRERLLSRIGTQFYYDRLRSALRQSSGVFVFNPLIAVMLESFAPQVIAIPFGAGFHEVYTRVRAPTCP